MPYNPKKNGAANYKSWMQLTPTQISTIEAIEGDDLTDDPNSEKFAQVVYVLNQSAGGSSSGVIVDGVNDTLFATVADLTNANPLATMLVDANGDQITSFGSASTAEGVHDAAAAVGIMQMGGVAETSTPATVADGDAVRLWIDESGRLVIKGYDQSSDSINMNLVNDSRTPLDTTALIAVSANTTGSSVSTADYNKLTFHIIATSVTFGADVLIQSSNDGANWVTINPSTKTITSTGNSENAFSDIKYKYVRAAVENYVDGTYTVTIYGGN